MKARFLLLPIVAALALAACDSPARSADPSAVGEFDQALTGSCAITPDAGLSLFVTNAKVMANFPLETVMNQIAASGKSQTGLELYQQLLDTLNLEDAGVTAGPHCNDVLNDAGQATINGFPIECPRAEGSLASTNPFSPSDGGNSYIPVALVNRFDLAPRNGANCGEYRIIYALQEGAANPLHRLFLIFEATLPNPNVDGGLAACLPVAEFWDGLSAVDGGIRKVATQLTNFYFTGLPGFEPVVQAKNYGIGGGTNTGQIRANMFFADQGELWQLREFRLSQKSSGEIVANNTFVRNNPQGTLFGATDAQSLAFQTEFLSQVRNLAAPTSPPTIAMNTPAADNAGESNEQAPGNNYIQFADAGLLDSIAAKLTALKITNVTATDVVNRATTQSCAGCHELSSGQNLGGPDGGVIWPPSLGFVQQDERGNLGSLLTQSFLPFRATVLVNFINQECGGADAGIDGDPSLNVGGGQVGSAN